MPKKDKVKSRERMTYYCEINAWHADGGNWRDSYDAKRRHASPKTNHNLGLYLEVKLLNPVKGVSFGWLHLRHDTKVEDDGFQKVVTESVGAGGYLNYRNEDGEKFLDGAVWVNSEGFLSLMALLTTGHNVIIDLSGNVFYRRKAAIDSVRWFTAGHPMHEDDLQYFIESSKSHK